MGQVWSMMKIQSAFQLNRTTIHYSQMCPEIVSLDANLFIR